MTHATYNIFSTERIVDYDDIHGILTHAFEVIDETYQKTNSKNYFPDFKLLKIEQNYIKIATSFSHINKAEMLNCKNGAIIIAREDNVEEYNFKNDDSVFVNGLISYSKHLKRPFIENEKLIKNKRVVWLTENDSKKSKYDKTEISELFKRYGLTVEFDKSSDFCAVYIDYNKKNENKKRFKDVFEFSCIAKVVDCEKVNMLTHTSIGRGKSYGFGAVWVKST